MGGVVGIAIASVFMAGTSSAISILVDADANPRSNLTYEQGPWGAQSGVGVGGSNAMAIGGTGGGNRLVAFAPDSVSAASISGFSGSIMFKWDGGFNNKIINAIGFNEENSGDDLFNDDGAVLVGVYGNDNEAADRVGLSVQEDSNFGNVGGFGGGLLPGSSLVDVGTDVNSDVVTGRWYKLDTSFSFDEVTSDWLVSASLQDMGTDGTSAGSVLTSGSGTLNMDLGSEVFWTVTARQADQGPTLYDNLALVPEPTSVGLLVLGGTVLLSRRRKA
jgi:hypothetical protein